MEPVVYMISNKIKTLSASLMQERFKDLVFHIKYEIMQKNSSKYCIKIKLSK